MAILSPRMCVSALSLGTSFVVVAWDALCEARRNEIQEGLEGAVSVLRVGQIRISIF